MIKKNKIYLIDSQDAVLEMKLTILASLIDDVRIKIKLKNRKVFKFYFKTNKKINKMF